ADGSWQWVGLGLGSYQGRAPDLELNAQGQPRIVYVSEDYSSEESAYGSLFYGWCDTNCQSAGGQWQHKRVENGFILMAEWEAGYPEPCGGGFWSGRVPAL